MKKQHALHNEKTCDFLLKDGSFNDWVVTTAFYSALQFVQHEIFPLVIGTRTYTSFDNYYNGYFVAKKNKPSKHSATITLVHREISQDIGTKYKWLHDTCRTARYNNFKTDPRIAALARKRLDEIKDVMTK